MAFIILVDVNLNKLTPLRQLKIKNKKNKKTKKQKTKTNIYILYISSDRINVQKIYIKENKGLNRNPPLFYYYNIIFRETA
jgi:hypothetical protein